MKGTNRRTIKILKKILAIENHDAVCVRDDECDAEEDAILEEDERGDVAWA